MITGDFHMHTNFSSDSKASPEEMIEGALKKGLKTICITDHYDEGYPFCEDTGEKAFLFDVEKYFETFTALRAQYEGRLDIRIGVEIGLQPQLGEFYKSFTNNYAFDFVIGSIHLVNGKDPYYQEMFEGCSDQEIYEETFLATLESLESVEDFDVLGHIDYVVRYGKNKAKAYNYRMYADLLDAILKRVIAMGKGIEMNMAGFKYGLGFCHPHPDVIKRYKELGGEIITVGGDGHRPEHIAYEFCRAGDVLKSCGFKYYTEFKARKPIFKQLP